MRTPAAAVTLADGVLSVPGSSSSSPQAEKTAMAASASDAAMIQGRFMRLWLSL
jgi:hypothetical protein